MSISGINQLQPARSIPQALKPKGNDDYSKEVPEKMELRKYFPALYEGRLSSSHVDPDVDIRKDMKGDYQRERLYKAAQEFQAIFIDQMLNSMRKTLNKKDDLFYGGNKQDIFEDMLYTEYSRVMSKSPGFNLADKIYDEMSRSLPRSPEGSPAANEYEKNMRRYDGTISTGNRKNAWEWGSP